MTVNYTTNLALGQPVTGTESGQWGNDVNNAVTSYLDIAIAGGLAIPITTADVTLAITQGNSSATGIVSTGATGSTAQYATLIISGAKTAARNLNVPASSRNYIINNSAATGGFLLTVRGLTLPSTFTTGVTLVDGERAVISWNGTDYVKVTSSVVSNLTGTLPVANGGTGVTTSTGSGNNVLSTSPTFVTPILGTPTSGVLTNATGLPLTTGVTGTLPVANGGTNSTATPTIGGVGYGTGTAHAYTATPGTGLVLVGQGVSAPAFGVGAATTPVVVTFSATAMTVSCLQSNVFTVTMTANVTTAPTLSSPIDGQTINWFITQDATGSRTMTWPTSFKWSGGSTFAGVLSTSASAVDLLVATYRSSTGFWYASLSKGFA